MPRRARRRRPARRRIGDARRRAASRQARDQRLGIRNRAEHAALHLDHLERRQMVAASVAAQQSSSSRHSKPRSLASRIVVCTQTSVVMPVSTIFSMPLGAQDQFEVGGAERAFAGLVDDDLAGQRREFLDDLPARLAAHEDLAAGASVADAGADAARAPALVGGQIGQVGPMALAGVDDCVALRRAWPRAAP